MYIYLNNHLINLAQVTTIKTEVYVTQREVNHKKISIYIPCLTIGDAEFFDVSTVTEHESVAFNRCKVILHAIVEAIEEQKLCMRDFAAEMYDSPYDAVKKYCIDRYGVVGIYL